MTQDQARSLADSLHTAFAGVLAAAVASRDDDGAVYLILRPTEAESEEPPTVRHARWTCGRMADVLLETRKLKPDVPSLEMRVGDDLSIVAESWDERLVVVVAMPTSHPQRKSLRRKLRSLRRSHTSSSSGSWPSRTM